MNLNYNNKFHQFGRRSISAFPQVSFSARQLPYRHVVNSKENNHHQVVDGNENHHHQMINGKETKRLDGDDPHNYGLVGSSLRQETKEDFDLVSLQKRRINDVKIGNVSSVLDKEEEEDGEEEEEEEIAGKSKGRLGLGVVVRSRLKSSTRLVAAKIKRLLIAAHEGSPHVAHLFLNNHLLVHQLTGSCLSPPPP